ncbi:MAG: UDPglucose 6-dehydrogenase, partial [Actinomycetota bacterium]|nr:UDPglucose 6-dehydrogenase [Actinomycetota bacterium]
VCELVGADITEVAGAMGIDRRIGPQFLEAGVGWGGSCFGKDLDALISIAAESGYRPQLLEATHAVNRHQRDAICDKLRRTLTGLRGRRIGLLGLSFKPGTDDLRDAPSLDIARHLIGAGALVTAFDPVVENVPVPELKIVPHAYDVAYRADAVVLVTEWPEFLGLDFTKIASHMRGNVFVDGRNLFDPATIEGAGLIYESMGRTPHVGPGIRSAIDADKPPTSR